MASDLMRLSGLNSGYDSEAMIEKMLSTYQTKIDTQNKKLTKLTWQQEAYRDIISKFSDFKGKYFDILKRDSYLMSPTSFSKFKSNITNKTNADKNTGLQVTTSSSAVEGNYKLNVERIATASTRTGAKLGEGAFQLDIAKAIDTSEFTANDDGSKTYSFALDVQVGNVSKTIEFEATLAASSDAVGAEAAEAQFTDDIIAGMNTKLADAFGEIDKGSGKQFIQAKKNDDGTVGFEMNGNAGITITEKTGNFGLTRPSWKVAIATQAAVTGENTIAVNVNGVEKSVRAFCVSDTYFDSRNESGNGDVLNQYNELKAAAYRKEYDLADDATVSQAQLDSFTYTSTQAAKDYNSAQLKTAMDREFRSEGIEFTIDGSYVMAKKGSVLQELSVTATSGGTFGLAKGSITNKFTDKTYLSDLGVEANAEGRYTMKINGKEISVDNKATISDLVSAVNKSGAGVTMTYSKLENRFVVTANDLGNGGDVDIEDDDEFAKAIGLTGTGATYELGENAKFTMNGVEVYHNSNSYTLDGVTFDISEVETNTDINVSVTKDYDDIKKSIKDFVNDYNQLIDDINNYTGTAPARDSKNNKYEPLSDAEKEEMSEDEIEKWETLAKKGVLYNDSTVTSVMSKLRMAMYNSVKLDDGSSFGLYNMGIKTVSGLTDKEGAKIGKLAVDEEALDKAFEENPDAITKLFTDPNSGVMKQISNVIDDAISTTRVVGNTVRGSLVRRAGMASGVTSTDNAIYRQMEQITKRINTLQNRYDSKEEYWWGVFTNLEKMMSDMNSQSSYLASYLGNFGSTQ